MFGLSLKCSMVRMCFFTASTISGWELGTSFESVARAQDGQSVTELCPSDPGVGELLTIIQQSTNKNLCFRSKDILAAKVVVIPFFKGTAFLLPPLHTQVFFFFFFFSLSSANSLEQEQKVLWVKFCLQVPSLNSVSAIDVCDCQ